MELINREQRRKAVKILHKKGRPLAEAKMIVALHRKMSKPGAVIKEGEAVMLNAEAITSRKDFAGMEPAYIEFVTNNKEKVFTVMYDPGRLDNPTLVSLREDTKDPKWLFWQGDLIRRNAEDVEGHG